MKTLLTEACRLRVQHSEQQPTMNLAILFSGGLDCSLLAYYCHSVLPPDTPIDLLNVAFQNPRIHDKSLDDPYSTCPDRITAVSSYAELSRLCPGRRFQLVYIDVPFSESQSHRLNIIELMHPHNTEMDFSIAMALHFAARGEGYIISTSGDRLSYRTTSRVLLSGLGADELFGGYGRHSVAFSRAGFGGLLGELSLDFSRLGKRNLGRDDRVTAHWAREVRYPFLDEDLVAWAVSAPVWEKCGFGSCSSQGSSHLEPGKLILRLMAQDAGLLTISREKKRAVRNPLLGFSCLTISDTIWLSHCQDAAR